jgi:pyrimidine operon attenuation protein/uracil phosphoribosyltransferase
LKTILEGKQLNLVIKRLAQQLIENHEDFSDTVLIGIQPRGIPFAERILQAITQLHPRAKVQYGRLDITFYRDDIRKEFHKANETSIPFSVENMKVVLIDDVLHTGRTIRAAMDALLDYGRPSKVELCVLIDRRFSRQLPIQPDYCGKAIDSIMSQKVMVVWNDDEVILIE